MKALGDYLHDRGLKYGIYSDAGTMTCAGMQGSLGHEEQGRKEGAKKESRTLDDFLRPPNS